MSVLAGWLVIGVPALVVAMAMFLGRSPRRAALGYLVLAAGFLAMAFLVDRISAGVLGGLLALLYGAGRGGAMDHEPAEHDEVGVPETTVDAGHGHVGAANTG